MQNSVMANLEFYFRGIRHTPSAIIDMDACLRHEDPTLHIYEILASENAIGRHSHEFDVMAMEDLEFSEPSGLVADFLENGKLDLDGLFDAWQLEKIRDLLLPIARRHLGIDNFNDHPALMAALIEAYQAA